MHDAKDNRGATDEALTPAHGPVPLVVSAADAEALATRAAGLAALLRDVEDPRPIAAALARAPVHHAHRLAVTGEHGPALAAQLVAFAEGREPAAVRVGGPVAPPRVAFVFAGHGGHWPGMGRELLARDAAFREAFLAFAGLMRHFGGPDVVAALERTDAETWGRAWTVQPLIGAVQIGLLAALRARGIAPDVVAGHSAGDTLAMYAASVYDLRSAARVTAERARALREAPPGRMSITDADAATLQAALAGIDGACMAGQSSPRSWALSGDRAAVEAVEARLIAAGCAVRDLGICEPMHSPLIAPAAAALGAATADVPWHPPRVPIANSLTGTWQTEFLPTFWRDHLALPIRLGDLVETLLDDGVRVFVELAPHAVLSRYFIDALANRGGGHVVPTMRRGRSGLQTLAEAVGALYVAGVTPDWEAIFPPSLASAPLPPWRAAITAAGPKSATARLSDLPRRDRPAAVRRHLEALLTDLLGLAAPPNAATPLVNLGFDSMLALRLRARLERLGVDVSLGKLTGDTRLADLVGIVEAALDQTPVAPVDVRPEPAVDPRAPFPLTDIQAAYLAGRSPEWAVGGVACHAAFELEGPALDPARLAQSWLAVVDRHPAWRTVLTADGRQRILDERPPWTLPVHDLRTAGEAVIAAHLDETWARFALRMGDPQAWPSFAIELTQLPDDRCVVHLDFDLMPIDGAGMFLALEEWAALHADPNAALPPASDGFQAAVVRDQRQRATARWRAHEAWWVETIDRLPPPPELPFARAPSTLQGMRFEHHAARIEPADWRALIERARTHGVSPSVALGAAFGEVLAAWSGQHPLTLTLTLFRPPADFIDKTRLIGEFTTTVLVEVTGAEPTFAARARGWRDRLAAALDHVDCSALAGLRAHARETGHGREFPVIFTSFAGQSEATMLGTTAWLGETRRSITQTPQAWLDCQVMPDFGGAGISWDVPEGLFPPGMMASAFAAWADLLLRLARHETEWQAPRFALLPPAQRARRERYGRTGRPAPEGRLFDAFCAQVDAAPERIAVIGPDVTLDYAALDARANQIGQALAEHDVRPGEPVVVCLPRGAGQVMAVLGVHAAGGAYVPLDAGWPAARRAGICASSGARIALTDGTVDDLPADVIVINIATTVDRSAARRPAPQAPSDRAYIIHTSGSTGAPKGVVMSHRATLNTIVDINRRFGVGPDDRVLSVSSLAFDLSVYDLFGPLSVGGAVVMLSPDAAQDVHRWMRLIERHRVTLWNSVPALFELLVEAVERQTEVPGRLRAVLLSGDWVPVDLPGRGRALWPEARIDSLGGATEAAIWSIAHPTDALDPAAPSVPYGTPLTAQRLYVLDRFMQPAPEWVPGELYIGGAGLADGYWRDPERTAARFVEHPETGERLYRTGDLGRFVPAGHLEFLGRSDSQVKIGGYRIELGEIEAALRALRDVRDAVVDAPGERHRRRLVGYVVRASDAPGPFDGAALEAALAARLPAVMVPRTWVELLAIPLNVNGKVDRRALPAPRAPNGPKPARVGPAGSAALDRVLAAVAEVMPGLAIGADDDLLRAGANSVDLIRLGVRLNEVFGTRPPMTEILSRGTPAALARFYARDDTPPPVDALPMLVEPEARDALKARRLGLRATDERALPLPAFNPVIAAFLARTSQRSYAADPVSRAALGQWLSVLCPVELGGTLRYRHASAGATYAVRTYLYLQPRRVAGQSGGAFYHDPIRHALAPVGDGRAPTPEMHVAQNRPWAEDAPILVFFVVERQAIEPIYGAAWRDFALIEIGARCQLLEERAAACGLGACQ
ncbi:MAG: amino acid adenylation domain-containing protein, partial [Myxococcales bacterium]|nr:amino acid adenylation domain-containing protein [Myxococcales bacterium]